ncbi:MAG: NAD-dependent protein deacetylase [Sandaracinaceae bacterium]|nr:NAD-dependent protein deacetylase [Sandaracinaceae bacterium]
MLERVIDLFRAGDVAVLTGAGVSTESGIPDYRGPGTLKRARTPIRFADYMATHANRARYWARSMVGWERFSQAQPNAAHRALAELEASGVLAGLITQNVDRLHHRAGHQSLVELHGALAEARCLSCGSFESRASIQLRLLRDNPQLHARYDALAPDGDAALPDEAIDGFIIPTCEHCGGVLKPNVVFFGENVPKERVERSYGIVDRARTLLVVGSSLTVFSGLRFVRRAKERGMQVAIINLGQTRGDNLADVRVEATAGTALQTIKNALSLH